VFKNNDVIFQINNSQAYFAVEGHFFYGENDYKIGKAYSTYSDSYTVDDYYSDKRKEFQPWNIGKTEFIIDDYHPENNIKKLYYNIKVDSLNPVNDLYIKLSGIAFNPAGDFTTEIIYHVDGQQPEVVFNNDPQNSVNTNKYAYENTVNIYDELKLAPNDSANIMIVYTLVNKVNPINARNNILFEIGLME